MTGAPLVAQGNLNRLRGSIIFPDFPSLNITAPFLGPEGINLNPEGVITDVLETMTGTVNSPVPYQMVTVEVELLKTQSFSDLFKQQLESDSVLGDFTVRVDTTTLTSYAINNGSIAMASPGRLNGKNVGFMVTFRGFYLVNSTLYDAA
jgi:hypothetical protein